MIGKTLGHYKILEQLGRGGMGEVYLAEDQSLDRKVALKFLPDVFTGSPERMARFEREAKLLASLNHPNIAAIYGLEHADGKRFLIMEYVEGETLQARLSKGALPVEEALGVCRQIGEGLEAAHEKGVIHRDLKPANVMITSEEKVKILDFGLAKALLDEGQSVDSSQSPTITEAMTQPGIVLGTAAYMSPEQAKGKSVDKRADIWAFGCILYECLTGKRAFGGETVTETLAAVIKEEPDLDKVSAKVRPLLQNCLQKDPSRRLRDIGDAWQLTQNAPESIPSRQRQIWPAWAVAALLLVVLAVTTFDRFREKEPASVELMRFQIDLPDNVSLSNSEAFALSPNGRLLAFAAAGSDGFIRLWLRSLDSIDMRPLEGTEHDSFFPQFFWSPDSRFIAFDAGGKLKKVDITTGLTQPLCDLTWMFRGGSWNDSGVIIFGDYGSGIKRGIMRLSDTGGSATPVTELNAERQETYHSFPVFLPDGRHFLYLISSAIPENAGIYLGSLDSNAEEQGYRKILSSNEGAIYVPSSDSSPAQLLFTSEQTLMAQPFDDQKMKLTGEPISLAKQVGSLLHYGFFSASKTGILVYRSSLGQFSQLSLFDRRGKHIGAAEGSGTRCLGLSLSPDGTRAAVSWISSLKSTSPDIWLVDFMSGTPMRFTYGQGINTDPIWSPDGSRIIYMSDREGVHNLYLKQSSGLEDEELLLKSEENKFPSSWSSDGRYLMYNTYNTQTKGDLWIYPLNGDSKPTPLPSTQFDESQGFFSPDMHWIAYESDESGTKEVYIRSFSPNAVDVSSKGNGKWPISRGGGMAPRWRADGKELYYRAPDGTVMAVEITANKGIFHAGTPWPLFTAPLIGGSQIDRWDADSDGERFLILTAAPKSFPEPFAVILNWTALLKK